MWTNSRPSESLLNSNSSGHISLGDHDLAPKCSCNSNHTLRNKDNGVLTDNILWPRKNKQSAGVKISVLLVGADWDKTAKNILLDSEKSERVKLIGWW